MNLNIARSSRFYFSLEWALKMYLNSRYKNKIEIDKLASYRIFLANMSIKN